MSENDTEQFQPFSVANLENFDREKSNRTNETPPDFSRFELLFEKPIFDEEEDIDFKNLYNGKKNEERIEFKPLIERKGEQRKEQAQEGGQPQHGSDEAPSEPDEPEKSPEEKGYKTGFENGFTEGIKEGQDQGYKQGFEKGEAQGFAKGEQDGFAQGETNGHEKGYETGLEQGREEAMQSAVPILESLANVMTSLEGVLPELLVKYEDRIIGLIRQICEKAVSTTVEINDEIVKSMILDAMKTLVAPEEIEVTVSEEDYEYIEMVKDDFFEKAESLQNIIVKSDSAVQRGGCKIKTSTAMVETDPQSRLDQICEAIRNAKSVG